MKLTERLKAIERFALEHRPPQEIRTHFHFLQEHLEMDDSLLDRISANDAKHAKELSDFKEESRKQIGTLQRKNQVLVAKDHEAALRVVDNLAEQRRSLHRNQNLDHSA